MALRSALAALLLAGSAAAAEKSVTLKISGWHSKGDAYKAENAVRGVKGVKSASADPEKKVLTIVFDDAVVTQAKLENAITDGGYQVEH